MASPIPLSMPDDLLAAVRHVADQTHLSQQDVIRQSTKAGLPIVLEKYNSIHNRVTNVDPLPAAQWRKIYGRKDELDAVSAKDLSGFQSQKEPS